MAPLPAPIRAGLGLLATALDAVQELVEHAPDLPMEAVGNSMQLSLRLQQQYAALQSRGDEFVASLRGAPEEPPTWATFDDLPTTAADAEDGDGDGVLDNGLDGPGPDAHRAVFDDEVADMPAAELQDEPRYAAQGDPLLDAALSAPLATAAAGAAGKKAPAKKLSGVKVGAKKVGAKKAGAQRPAGSSGPAGAPPALAKVAARKVPATKAPAKKAAAKKAAVSAAVALESTTADLGAAPASSTQTFNAAPHLDAALDNGDASARPRSAFDLAEPTDDPAVNGSSANGPAVGSSILDASTDGGSAAAGDDASGSAPGA